MRRKNLMTALMCTLCLTVSTAAAPMMVLAEDAETVTEAETAGEDDEAVTEAETAGEEAETEETEALPERPEYQASDYVTLGEYKGLSVSLEPLKVTDEDIDEEVRYYVQMADALETLTEGTVQEGDTANIDYEGKLNGDAFDGGTAKGYDLVIGSHSFIDGFEDGLIGVSVGQTVDLPLTFPENYMSEELAGKEVVFTVTVNEIKRMPELTDELASTVSNGEYTDAESYRESIRTMLEENNESQKEYFIKSELLTQVVNVSEIKEYPQEMLDYGYNNMVSYYKEYAESFEMEYADFLSTYFGLTEEEFDNQINEMVKQNLRQEMFLKAIAEAEGFEVSDEEYAAGCERYAEENGYDTAEELVAAYGESVVRISLLQDKVLDFLMDNAVIEEETETESETGLEESAEDGQETAAEAVTEASTEGTTEAE